MGILDRIFPRGPIEVKLTPVRDAVMKGAVTVAARAPHPALVTARLADRIRDAKGAPVGPSEWGATVSAFDPPAWQRLAVIDLALAEMPVASIVGAGVSVQLLAASLAAHNPLLTLDLLRAVHLRAEELARKLIASAGCAVAGEPPDVSNAQLTRLDYARVLAEAERAKAEAAERMKMLEALRDKRGPGRGKR